MSAQSRTWFGTRGYEQWIPTPAINPDYSRSGYSTSDQYLNGFAGVRESKNAHNVYILSWTPTKTRDAIRVITDFADGVYDPDDGINLIYWIDPMAADKNVLCQAWATPSLGSEDGVSLITDPNGVGRPKAVPMPPNSLQYPARAAQYTLKADSVTLEQYIPIPPNHSAWVGIHGDSAAQDLLEVQRVNGSSIVGSVVVPTVLDATDNVRVNTEFSSADSSGIVLQFATVASDEVFVLYGLMVQILPIGQAPEVGGFISGQGHSGCQFVGKPSKTPYSAKLDRVGATARLTETGMGL